MRCADCETEPLSPARYCECCGREIALHQEQSEETLSGADDWAPNPNPTLDLRYEAHQPSAPEATGASSQDASARAMVAKADMPPAQPEATTTPIPDRVPFVDAKLIEPEVVKPRESLPKPATSTPIHAERVQRSPAASRRPIVQATVPVTPDRQRHSSKVAIGALLIGAVVVGAPWLRVHKESLIARVNQLANVVSSNGVTEVAEVAEVANQPLPTEPPTAPPPATQVREPQPPKVVVPAKASQDRKPATAASPVASTPVRPKPVTPARPPRPVPAKAVATKPVRAKEPAREVPAVAVLAAKPSAPVIAAPAVEVAAAAPAPRPEALGPFFESNQVNEPPRMTPHVEPRLPVELRNRSVKEIVVVRALVSQSGHPTRVSLLRRSKTGPQLDDVVLAAVNQWTFSPARKKGEPVSCWFNFAVPVGQ